MHSEVFLDLVNSAQTTDFVVLNLEGGELIPYLVNTECDPDRPKPPAAVSLTFIRKVSARARLANL